MNSLVIDIVGVAIALGLGGFIFFTFFKVFWEGGGMELVQEVTGREFKKVKRKEVKKK